MTFPNKITSGSVPKYRQLLQILRDQIIRGDISPGEQIPTEDALIAEYGISRGTVRKAIDQLEAERLIRKEHGVGSFVLEQLSNSVPFHFPDTFAATIYGKEKVTFEEITKSAIPAPMHVAEKLRISPGESVIHIARKQRMDGEVFSFTTRYIPEGLSPSLMKMDLSTQSIHNVLVFVSDIPLLRAELEIEAHIVNHEEAALLETDENTAVVAVNRITYTAPNRPAVWYQALYKKEYYMQIAVQDQH